MHTLKLVHTHIMDFCKTFVCDVCKKTFLSFNALKFHKKFIHLNPAILNHYNNKCFDPPKEEFKPDKKRWLLS